MNNMKKIFTATLFSLSLSALFGQEIKHYDLIVDFNIIQKKIDVKVTIEIDYQDKDSLILVLWKNTKIQNILFDKESADYSFDTTCKSPNYYIPDGGKLIIKNIKKKNYSKPIYFSYTCDMKNIAGWAKSFSEDWIELGFYTAWYPVHNESKEFTSIITISIDDDFKVSGSGIVTKDGNTWKIIHHWPVFDNVIIAAKDLKSKKIGGDEIDLEFVYTKFPEKDLDSVTVICQEIYEFYSSIFGKQENAYLKYVLNPLKGRGGYSRTKFVSIKVSGYNQYLKEGLAHEMAHFWWNNAITTTWDDWLNEAFAEYSMLIYLREKDTKETFNNKIIQYKEWIKNSLPIWGVDRETPEAYTALYNKGSLILMEFEEKLGTDNFYLFLRTLLINKISTTADFLNLVEMELSKEYKVWFENKLKM
jgi:hypothetical protein